MHKLGSCCVVRRSQIPLLGASCLHDCCVGAGKGDPNASATRLAEGSFQLRIGCKPCRVARQGACGTKHRGFASCTVLKRRNDPDVRDLFNVLLPPNSVLAEYVICLLSLSRSNVTFPPRARVQQLLEEALPGPEHAIIRADILGSMPQGRAPNCMYPLLARRPGAQGG